MTRLRRPAVPVTAALLLGAAAATVLSGPPAGATTPTPAPGYAPGVSSWGVLQIPYRRTDGGVTVNFNGFPSDLGGSVSTGPTAMPFRPPGEDTRLWVAAAGTNGAVYHRHQTDSAPFWTPWTSAGGYTEESPAMACSGSGTAPVVFVVGADRALWRKAFTVGGWLRLGGLLTSAPAASPPVGGVCPTIDEDVVALGGDGAVWEFHDGAWSRIGGRSPYAPAIMRSAKSDSTHVFVVGTDRALWTASRVDGGGWSGFSRIGGSWNSAPAATEYPTSAFGPGSFAVVALGANDQVYRAAGPITGPGAWTFTHLP